MHICKNNFISFLVSGGIVGRNDKVAKDKLTKLTTWGWKLNCVIKETVEHPCYILWLVLHILLWVLAKRYLGVPKKKGRKNGKDTLKMKLKKIINLHFKECIILWDKRLGVIPL